MSNVLDKLAQEEDARNGYINQEASFDILYYLKSFDPWAERIDWNTYGWHGKIISSKEAYSITKRLKTLR